MARRTRRTGRMLTGVEAARYLGVTRKTIYNWTQSGLLTPVSVEGCPHPRFALAKLERIKEEAAEAGVPVTYNVIRMHHNRQGVPDGRRKESASV